MTAQLAQEIWEKSLGIPLTTGNSVQVLCNGEEIFPAMLQEIEAAEHSVRLLTFIYWGGDVARQFAAALAKKARQGVTVQVLVDAVGSLAMPSELVEVMEQAGVHFRYFRPLTTWKLGRTNFRTHRKVMICDDRVGFTGGVGIATEWEGDARNPEEWRETHFRIQGPAVASLEGAFWGNWLEAGGELDLDCEARHDGSGAGETTIQVIPSHGKLPRSEMLTVSEMILRLSQESLLIQTAYFVPDERMSEGLCAAAKRGVQVEIMLPGEHSDHRLCNLAGREQYATLLDAGVQIYTYEKTMLHTKVAVVDGEYAIVGSPNFNQRSVRRDDEVAMVLFDEALAGLLTDQFRADQESATQLDPDKWPRRGWVERAKEFFSARLRREL